jgi:hypothetical protein
MLHQTVHDTNIIMHTLCSKRDALLLRIRLYLVSKAHSNLMQCECIIQIAYEVIHGWISFRRRSLAV